MTPYPATALTTTPNPSGRNSPACPEAPPRESSPVLRAAPAHDWHRQQEREAGRGLALEPEQQRGRDGGAGPGSAGNQGQGLGATDQQAAAQGEVAQALVLPAVPVCPPDDAAHADEHRRDHNGVAQVGFDGVLEGPSRAGGRNRGRGQKPKQMRVPVQVPIRMVRGRPPHSQPGAEPRIRAQVRAK